MTLSVVGPWGLVPPIPPETPGGVSPTTGIIDQPQ